MIFNSHQRNGNFTSSKIAALMSNPTAKAAKEGAIFGAPANTYIRNKNYERLLGRAIEAESNAKALVWGKLLEQRVINLIGFEYEASTKDTEVHPQFDYWSGSKDAIKRGKDGDTVVDFKCPITLLSFCQLVDPLYNEELSGNDVMDIIREQHSDGDTYYWQLVSNACISDCKYAELIVYMPYLSELQEIKLMAEEEPSLYWVSKGAISELPYLVDGGYYKNLNIIRFEIPQQDKDFLAERVKAAGKMLIERPVLVQDVEFEETIISD